MLAGPEEAGVVERARGGDQAAFETLVEAYHRRVLAYLRRLVGNPDVALDLTQDTFVHAYRAIHQTRPELLVSPWLHRIATNVAYGYLRRQRQFAWLPLHVVDKHMSTDETSDILDCDLVQRALVRLAPEDRAVLLLCGLDAMPFTATSPLGQQLWQRGDPGTAYVEQAGFVRELRLSATHEGVTITLERAYADANRIVIGYTLGVPEALAGYQSIDAFAAATLRDTAGRTYTAVRGAGGPPAA